MKIGLGTAQFGLNYGISNRDGQTASTEVGRILSYARKEKIEIIDTAHQYGNSEETLGQHLQDGDSFRVVTKCPSLARQGLSGIKAAFEASLQRLRKKSLYGLLVHQADDLLGPEGAQLALWLQELKSQNKIQKIGASFYRGSQIDQVLQVMPIDLAQVPLNVFDQRLLASGHLAQLRRAGVEIHTRSAFLQGLLLMNPASLPAPLAMATEPLARFQATADRAGLSPMAAAIQFAQAQPEVSSVICGVNNLAQLEEICAAAKNAPVLDYQALALEDETLLNPALWPKS